MVINKLEELPKAVYGDIVIFTKLLQTQTSDTLSNSEKEAAVPNITFPKAQMLVAIEPLNKNDDEELNDSDPTKKAVMLLSMFHVSNSSHSYKNWLYAVLRWLFKNKDNIMRDNYVNFLEELCDKFYFGNNCQGKDITEIILDKVEFELNSEIKENSDDEKDWDDGVNVPNFVFNRLDYQLWKFFHEQEQKVEILSENDKWLTIKNKEAIWKKFRFTFRSSVEHHYPQHPSEEHGLEKLDKKTLDNFGKNSLQSSSL